ncbi:MAG: hypothetical protein IJR70_09235 [Eubacterium sp.]|nr:hypothetical protein [Eubacterium sp.]
MESKKSKVFTHKLIALFLAALMVISTFTGVMMVFAKSTDDYHDANLAANFLAWAETTDNQTAEALLDYADLYLPQIMEGLDLGDIKPRGTTRINFKYNVPVVGDIKIQGYADSIDGILELVKYVDGNILKKSVLGRSLKSWAGGDIQNINLDAVYDLATSTTDGVVSKCGVAYRSQNDAKDIILTVAKLIYVHSNDYGGKNIVKQFVTGNLNLGLIGNFLNLWDTLKEPLGMWDGYQTNLVYNIVANLIWQNTDWYSEAQINEFKDAFVANGANQKVWNFDDQLFGKLTSELLQLINVQVTYSNKVPQIELDQNREHYGEVLKDKNGETIYVKDSSKRRWFYIYKYIQKGMSYADAVAAVNANEGAEQGFYCDPNLRYSMNEDGTSDGNILLFTYGDNSLTVAKTDTVTNIAFNALEIAWDTVLAPTLSLLEVDYDRKVDSAVFDGHVSNFDRDFYAWKSAHGGWVKSDSDENAWKANYTTENINAWANAVYSNYSYKNGVTPSAATFLEGVKENYVFDRSVIEDAQNNWRDIDATKLFVELRYSPLADVGFDMQTGPINLYFAETGAANIKTFFSTAFTEYDSIIQGINNGLVAAVKDFFPDSANVGLKDGEDVINLARPALATTKSKSSQTIAETIVTNAAHIFEYAANSADENILGAFYANNAVDKTTSANLSEANFEEAALPMLISLLNQASITDTIHDEDWDTCIDAEGVAVVALREYLSYVLPDKDYSPLYKVNTKNQLVCNYDVNKDGNKDLFIDCIMPMARDALGYVLQSVVTCRKEDGTEWSVYQSSPTEDQTSIFTILNSVLCYYAGTDDFENSKGSGSSTIEGKGAAALLGCVDKNGKCTVTIEKDIWDNLDTIINTVLPVIGSLQTGTFGECDSHDLIYTKIIEGLLDIDGNGNGGTITNIIKQLADIIQSAPLNTGADVALYDYIVAPTVNAIFGPKYEGQTLTVVPENAAYFDSDSSSNTESASPFNSLIHVDILGNYQGVGIISILLSNTIEAFGINDYKSKSGDRWQGAMFAVKAVNNFIPSFVPQLSDMKFGPVTAKIDISSYSGMTGNQPIGTGNYLTVTNTSLGLNRFYRPGPEQKVQREKRYFAEIKSAEITDNLGDPVSNIYLSGTTTGVLAPGETLKIPILGSSMRRDGTYGYRVTVKYNMYEAELQNGNKPSANGDYMFNADITTYAYMVMTVGGSWQNALYPDGSAEKTNGEITKYKYVADSANNNTPGDKYGTGDAAVVNSSAGGQDGNLVASVPQNIVIPSDNPSIVDLYSIRVVNNGGSNRKYNGAVAYIEEGTQYYPVNGTTVSDTLTTMDNDTSSDMAYALIDEDGNLLNRDFYDYRIDEGEWQRGYDRETLDHMETDDNGSIKAEFDAGRVTERTHVTYTFQEALNAGIVKGVQKNGDTITNVFVTPSAALVAENSTSAITWVTPFDGFYFQNHGSTVSSGNSNYDFLLKYDENGVSAAKDAYKLNIAFVPESGNRMMVSTNVYIADQSDRYNLTDAYQAEVSKMASYRPSDFLDYNEATDKSENYSAIIDSMTDSLKLAATPLSVDAASKISSTKITQAATSETTNHGGDRAYLPATESQIPASVLASAYKQGDIYYLNKECTMPIYSNVAMTDDKVVDLVEGDPAFGKDSAGQDIVKYGGVWYLANETKYESEWDTTTYWTTDEDGNKTGAPYYAPVKDEDHIAKNNGNTVYLQKQFVYRDANGNKVNSDDRYDNGNYKWVVKFAVTDTVIKPNDGTDYRGAYQQGIDTINYYNSIFSKILKTVGAQSVAEEVTAVRSEDSNSVNYDVASYEKMVQIAREAEKLIWYEDAKDEDGNYIYKADGSREQIPATDKSSMEIEVAVNQFKKYYQRAQNNSRGYIGDKLEAEISNHHAIGGSYANFTATKTGEQVRFEYSTMDEDEEDNVDVYTIKVADGTELGFGARAADGTLVNEDAEGNKAYTDASWNAYVNALGAAVETATEKTAKVSDIYTAKAHLVVAENNLDPNTGEDTSKYTVTGKIVVSEDREGTSGTVGVGGIQIKLGNEVIGESAEDGSFEIQLTKGETSTLTITGETTVDRTITISGDSDIADAEIPVLICNYTKDNVIDFKDAGSFVDYLKSDYYAYADINGDKTVDFKDAGMFVDYMANTPVVYAEWSVN